MTPLFILGVPRSGTTLMRSLMRVFDGAYLPPDEFQLLPQTISAKHEPSQFFATLQGSNFAGHMRRRDLWPEDALVEIAAIPNGAEAFQALVLAIAKKDGVNDVTYWGDKTPENLFHLDTIFATWPDARIIHVLRDPRSTVMSMKKSWGRSPLRGSVIWRDGVQAIARHKAGPHADQIFEVRYETLTQDPVATLASLGAWLDLPFDAARLDNFQTEERWSSKHSKGIQHRGDIWNTRAVQGDVKTIEGVCFDAMKATDYLPIYATAQNAPGKMALKLAKAGDAWRVLRVYAKERGWSEALSYKLRQWRAAHSKSQ